MENTQNYEIMLIFTKCIEYYYIETKETTMMKSVFQKHSQYYDYMIIIINVYN